MVAVLLIIPRRADLRRGAEVLDRGAGITRDAESRPSKMSMCLCGGASVEDDVFLRMSDTECQNNFYSRAERCPTSCGLDFRKLLQRLRSLAYEPVPANKN